MKAKPIEIQQETKYWLVRPGVNSLFFDEFYNDGCIAIGWDRIGKIDENGQVYSIDSLKDLVEKKYEDLLSQKDSLKEYKGKVLALTGKSDFQADYRRLDDILGEDGITVVTPDNVNHLMRDIDGEASILNVNKDYKKILKKEISPSVKSAIKDWIKKI